VQVDACLALRAAALADDGLYGEALEAVSLREQAARKHQLGHALQEAAEQRRQVVQLAGVTAARDGPA
jgi:hypothetical protein